jgi:hypothetical protein
MDLPKPVQTAVVEKNTTTASKVNTTTAVMASLEKAKVNTAIIATLEKAKTM